MATVTMSPEMKSLGSLSRQISSVIPCFLMTFLSELACDLILYWLSVLILKESAVRWMIMNLRSGLISHLSSCGSLLLRNCTCV